MRRCIFVAAMLCGNGQGLSAQAVEQGPSAQAFDQGLSAQAFEQGGGGKKAEALRALAEAKAAAKAAAKAGGSQANSESSAAPRDGPDPRCVSRLMSACLDEEVPAAGAITPASQRLAASLPPVPILIGSVLLRYRANILPCACGLAWLNRLPGMAAMSTCR